jgi:hypothetical protein
MLTHDKDFLVMGLGIERRARAYHEFWSEHLRRSREFIAGALPESSTDVSILGAGRLYDIEIASVAQRSRCIRLADLDRGCEATWRRAVQSHPEVNFVYHFLDLTGVLRRWTSSIQRCNSRQALTDVLEQLSTEALPDPPIPTAAVVVSLNLLSQIPLYWRDRVEMFAATRGWGSFEESAGLRSTMEALQMQHLEGLRQCGADTIIIVTDVDFGADGPPALTPRVDFRTIPEYTLKAADAWTWTVVPPQPTDLRGEVHAVEAVAFRKFGRVEGMPPPSD